MEQQQKRSELQSTRDEVSLIRTEMGGMVASQGRLERFGMGETGDGRSAPQAPVHNLDRRSLSGVYFGKHGQNSGARSLEPTSLAPDPTSLAGRSLLGTSVVDNSPPGPPRFTVPGVSFAPLRGGNGPTVPPEDLSPTTQAYSQEEVDERMALIRAKADAAIQAANSRECAGIPATAPIEYGHMPVPVRAYMQRGHEVGVVGRHAQGVRWLLSLHEQQQDYSCQGPVRRRRKLHICAILRGAR